MKTTVLSGLLILTLILGSEVQADPVGITTSMASVEVMQNWQALGLTTVK